MWLGNLVVGLDRPSDQYSNYGAVGLLRPSEITATQRPTITILPTPLKFNTLARSDPFEFRNESDLAKKLHSES